MRSKTCSTPRDLRYALAEADASFKSNMQARGTDWVARSNGRGQIARSPTVKPLGFSYLSDLASSYPPRLPLECCAVATSSSAEVPDARTAATAEARHGAITTTEAAVATRTEQRAAAEAAARRDTSGRAEPRASRQHKRVITTAGDHDISCRNHNKNIPCGL